MASLFANDFFKCFFFNENKWISIEICTDVWTSECNWYSSIGSDNGLAPNKQQAIIWGNDGLVCWHMLSLALNKLSV